MNQKWSKENDMSSEDKMALHELRLTQHDESLREMRQDIKDIKDVLNRLDKKLTSMPEGGLQCNIHGMRMDVFEKRLAVVETISDNVKKKIVTWTAVFGVLLFVLSQLFIPYILNNYKITNTPATIQQSQTNFVNTP